MEAGAGAVGPAQDRDHARAFTVAKAMRFDLLDDIRRAVDAAQAEGLTFAQFRAELEPALRARGWWGKQEMVDPVTGRKRIAQLGSPRRLRIIYDTNIRMAGARGRWERIERLADRMPYLRYVATLDARTRPEHAAWGGRGGSPVVLPVNHAWWRTHYPPNGWHCRCTVVQLGEDDLERLGLSVSPDPVVDTWKWENERTQTTVQVPRGIDPGFEHNVGIVDRQREAAFRRLSDASGGAGYDRLLAAVDRAEPRNRERLPALPPRDKPDGRPRRDLSDAERAALYYYTSEGTALNRILRRHREDPPKVAEQRPRVGVVEAALAKLDDYKGTVYRGLDAGDVNLDRYRKDAIVREPQFTSASLNPDSRYMRDNNVHFHIKSKRSKYIAPWSERPQDVEVLFPTDALFVVRDVHRGDITRIFLEEID